VNDSYAVFPKVVSVGRNAKISIRGLRARTIRPGETYNVQVRSMTNYADDTRLEITALPPTDEGRVQDSGRTQGSPLREPLRGGVIEFNHTFATRGEYRIIVTRETTSVDGGELRAVYITKEYIYAAAPELAQLRPYRGDLHIHTYYSDGRMSPIYMAVVGRKLGLDFAAITDHGKYKPSLEAIEMAKEINLDLLLFPGEEVSFPSGHIVSVCASGCVTGLRSDEETYRSELREITQVCLRDAAMVGNLEKWQYAPAKWTVDKIHELGGYAFLAHPYWISGDRYHLNLPIFEQLLEDGDIDGVEIIGGYPPWEFEANLLSIAKYYAEAAKGREIPVLGNSDTHFRSTVDIYGWYWTTVFAKSLCKEDVFDAILNLKSVACERPAGERFMAYGPFDLVEYTCFLDREFFPLHDRICVMEAELYMDMLMGKGVSLDQLDKLRKNLEELYDTCWQDKT
jgi:predicted metal-dependent phosphoesterase TrpH